MIVRIVLDYKPKAGIEATDFKFGLNIRRVCPKQQHIKKFGEKGRAWAYPGTVHIFGGYPQLSQDRERQRTSTLARTFSVHLNKIPLKLYRKGTANFLGGTPYYVMNRQSYYGSKQCTLCASLWSVTQKH